MGLSTLDLVVIIVYLAGVTAFGLRFRKKQRTLKDYLLADNTIPWWAISLSIVAAETSTLTIISVPGLAYEKDFKWYVALGSILTFVVGYGASFLLSEQVRTNEIPATNLRDQ